MTSVSPRKSLETLSATTGRATSFAFLVRWDECDYVHDGVQGFLSGRLLSLFCIPHSRLMDFARRRRERQGGFPHEAGYPDEQACQAPHGEGFVREETSFMTLSRVYRAHPICCSGSLTHTHTHTYTPCRSHPPAHGPSSCTSLVLTAHSILGHSCYRPRRAGERKRKSVRGCIVDTNLSVLALVIVKKGDKEIPGLTGMFAQCYRFGPF